MLGVFKGPNGDSAYFLTSVLKWCIPDRNRCLIFPSTTRRAFVKFKLFKTWVGGKRLLQGVTPQQSFSSLSQCICVFLLAERELHHCFPTVLQVLTHSSSGDEAIIPKAWRHRTAGCLLWERIDFEIAVCSPWWTHGLFRPRSCYYLAICLFEFGNCTQCFWAWWHFELCRQWDGRNFAQR